MVRYDTGEIIELYGKKWRVVNPNSTHGGIVYSSQEVHETRGHCADSNWISVTIDKPKEEKKVSPKKDNNYWYKRRSN